LDSMGSVRRSTPETGELAEAQAISTRAAAGAPADARPNFPADIHVAPSGRFLYLSNRGHDSIAVYSIHPSTGALVLVELASTRGSWPRNFAIDPTGRFLFVAN